MTIKSSILALGVIAGIVLVGAPTTHAKAAKTTKTAKEASSKTVVVKAGDTLESIAKTNGTTYVRLFNANASIVNPDVIEVGDKLRVPKKGEKLPNRLASHQQSATTVSPTVVQSTPTTYTTQSYTTAPVNSNSYYVGNGMWCTDYVHSKRPDVAVYGNAGYGWMSAAEAAGKSTGSTPKAGAVAITNGHVAYVEKVNRDGSYVVSEMGWNYQAGNYNERTVKPGAFGGFIY